MTLLAVAAIRVGARGAPVVGGLPGRCSRVRIFVSAFLPTTNVVAFRWLALRWVAVAQRAVELREARRIPGEPLAAARTRCLPKGLGHGAPARCPLGGRGLRFERWDAEVFWQPVWRSCGEAAVLRAVVVREPSLPPRHLLNLHGINAASKAAKTG